MRFRDATTEDLPLIVEIYNSTIASRMVTADTEAVAVKDKLAWFNEHDSNKRPLWMVEDDGDNIIGWVSFQNFYGRPAYDGTAEISIYLDRQQRAKGYGKNVLQHCIVTAPSLGIHTLLGFIYAHNTQSLQLFTNIGFEEWAHLKNIALLDGKECSLKILGKRIA